MWHVKLVPTNYFGFCRRQIKIETIIFASITRYFEILKLMAFYSDEGPSVFD